MFVPKNNVTLDTGEIVNLSECTAGRTMAIVFLRHLGCIFCREHATQLKHIPEKQLIFVAMANVPEVQKFKREMDLAHTVVSDTERVLYQLFALKRGNLGQMFNVRTVSRGIKAARNGIRGGLPQSDPWQLGGTFIVAASGEIVWSDTPADASDNAAPALIEQKLKEAELLSSPVKV